jgi:hypothetical protein
MHEEQIRITGDACGRGLRSITSHPQNISPSHPEENHSSSPTILNNHASIKT